MPPESSESSTQPAEADPVTGESAVAKSPGTCPQSCSCPQPFTIYSSSSTATRPRLDLLIEDLAWKGFLVTMSVILLIGIARGIYALISY
jgi:hypothetical protein